MSKNTISLDISGDGEMAYLTLPAHPGKGTPGIVAKQIPLASLIKNYQGIDIYLDFDASGVLIGLEFFIE